MGLKSRLQQTGWVKIESDSGKSLNSHKQVLLEVDFMKSRFLILAAFCALVLGLPNTGLAQQQQRALFLRVPDLLSSAE